jgi:hypothetical protein
VTKVVGVLDHSLPVAGVVLRGGELLQFAIHLLQLGGEFLATELQFTESDYLCLIGIHEALTLPLQAVAALLELGLLSRERGQILLFTLRPVLVQRGDEARPAQ